MASTLVAMASGPKVELAVASRMARLASCTMTASPVLRSCVFFTHFRFELVFGINMEVVDNCVIFSVALV
ncbi:hypothetical protein MTR_0100s0110 [Medicago truncatula]|uniref:Uncharacterized protein n=1 Tax=Medicago truncatula TaxID=3880 RepID=A0A072TGR1_MEDTR|nr:hypothetical protein MTR_0100s0110 [Medicago truncatula]